MDDFLFFATNFKAALRLRDRIDALLNRLGWLGNPKKGM
jgi:hypothetical protein